MGSKLSFWSTWWGNLFEHYDSALFGFLAPFLAPLLFPEKEPLWALILTYAIVPLGMLSKPVGALVFGFLGDRWGRGKALSVTLIGMGVVSALMGFCPLYAQVGLAAPLFMYLGRLLQNFFASGEVTGGIVFLLEQTPKEKQDLVSGFYSASTIAGILCASAGVALLCCLHQAEGAWRLLYFLGGITALFGLLLPKTSIPSQPERSSPRSLLQLCQSLKEEKKALLWIAVVYGFSYATYTIALVLMNGFIPLISSITKEQITLLNTPLLLLDFCLLPLFGWIATKMPRKTLMLISCFATLLLGAPLMWLLEGGSLTTILIVRICFVVLGVSFCAPFYAWAQELVSPKRRYLILSLGCALGSQLIGGPTASFSLWLFKTTQSVSSVAGYWVLLAFCSCVTLLVARPQTEKTSSFP